MELLPKTTDELEEELGDTNEINIATSYKKFEKERLRKSVFLLVFFRVDLCFQKDNDTSFVRILLDPVLDAKVSKERPSY